MAASTPTHRDVRAWARANNIPVGDRGRLSIELIEQFNAGTNESRGGFRKFPLPEPSPV